MHAQLEKRRRIMFRRKLLMALFFVGLISLLAPSARAQDFSCDNPDFCFDFGIPSTVDNITGSSVQCALQPGGASDPFNALHISTGEGDPNTFTQTGTAKCKQLPGNADLGTCTFQLTITDVNISECTDNSFTATAFCSLDEGGRSGNVTGTITCASGVMNVGVVISNPYASCVTVFPSHNGLADGQLLDLTVKTKGSDAGACTGPFVSISDVKERYCNSGEPSSEPGDPDCTPATGPTRTTNPDTTALSSALSFDFNVRQTVNTKCDPKHDNGKANIDIFGSSSFGVDEINQGSLLCGGAPLQGCVKTDVNLDGFTDLACKVNTCPTFAPALGKLPRNPDGTVTATCTGQLNSTTAILGTDKSVQLSGK
jgi:hypothetical protein